MYIRTASSLSKRQPYQLFQCVSHSFHSSLLSHSSSPSSLSSSSLFILFCALYRLVPHWHAFLFLFPKKVKRPNPKFGLHRTCTWHLILPHLEPTTKWSPYRFFLHCPFKPQCVTSTCCQLTVMFCLDFTYYVLHSIKCSNAGNLSPCIRLEW